jgi:hypothetical protein
VGPRFCVLGTIRRCLRHLLRPRRRRHGRRHHHCSAGRPARQGPPGGHRLSRARAGLRHPSPAGGPRALEPQASAMARSSWRTPWRPQRVRVALRGAGCRAIPDPLPDRTPRRRSRQRAPLPGGPSLRRVRRPHASPLYILHPSLVIRVHRGEEDDLVDVADLRQPEPELLIVEK